jgi:hypothetical protein
MRDAAAVLDARQPFATGDYIDLRAICITRVHRDIAAFGAADSRGVATADRCLVPVRERGDERGKPATHAPFLRRSTV